MRFALKRGPERLSVDVAGAEVAVAVRRDSRARRLILRIDGVSGAPVLTLPARTSLSRGESFLRKHAGWLENRLGRRPPAVPFRDGGSFPLRGSPCRIVHRGGRGLVTVERLDGESALIVPGDPDHLERRVKDWLKKAARQDFEAAVARHAPRVGRQPERIRIGDPRSRWGSCTSAGGLNFSWRLILAPPHVLDYLAAHEVAHLKEMNHGPDFWALVACLDPHYRLAQAWLKQNGPSLHAIGRAA